MLPLPTSLRGDYDVQDATSDDAEALQQLFVAHRRSVLGVCRVTVAEVRSWLDAPPERDVFDLVVRRRGSGRAVQWWSGSREHGDPRFMCLITSHPDLARAEVDALWSAGWSRLRQWIDGLDDRRGGSPIARSACLLGDADNQRRLAEVGFVHERTFWEMAGPVSGGAASGPVPVPGLRIRAAADPVTVHALIQAGFRDHWDFHPQAFDDWWSAEQVAHGFDAALWHLAELDGEPVAAMILCRYDDELYVQEVATLSAFRRRGIASVLLARAFTVAREAGLSSVMLHVDSDNADGAPRIYRSAGLEVRHATLQHTLPLGREER